MLQIIKSTLTFYFIIYCHADKLTEVTKTTKGSVVGKISKTVEKNIEYSVYFGIPFAKPPLGNLRFKPPEEVDSWTGVLNATKEPNLCPQSDPLQNYTYAGDEDCLYLNVYTPKINSTDTSKRAVMFWIYAGAFVFGSISPSLYGPDYLIEENVIVVMANHRLGALGFLSLNHENATGNAGLKDQVSALKWVQENIENFGGDPNRVSIFGDSSGSASVGYLILSDISAGLFQSAISMSGTPLNTWSFEPLIFAKLRSFILGLALGIVPFSKSDLLEGLYTKSAEDIVKATDKFVSLDVLSYAPTIEDPKIATMPIITECSIKKYKAGNFTKVPQIIGFVKSETLSFIIEGADKFSIVNSFLQTLFDLPILRPFKNIDFLTSLTDWILGKFDVVVDHTIYGVANVTSDLLLIFDIDRTQRYLAASEAPIYYYRNSFDHENSRHKKDGSNLNGTAHADDVFQIFWPSLPDFTQPRGTKSRLGIQRQRMVRMWTNFAKYGNPTPNGTMDPLLNITWPVSNSDGRCLEINTNYTVGPRPVGSLVDTLQTVVSPLLGLFTGCRI